MTVDELKNIGSDVIAFAEAEYQKAKALPGDNAARMIAVYGIVVEVVQKAQAVRADFAGMTAADVEGLAVLLVSDVVAGRLEHLDQVAEQPARDARPRPRGRARARPTIRLRARRAIRCGLPEASVDTSFASRAVRYSSDTRPRRLIRAHPRGSPPRRPSARRVRSPRPR